MAGLVGETMAASRSRVKAVGVSDLLMMGAVAGLFAGFLFILANMWYAPTQNLPATAPFNAIGTIFYRDAMPQMTAAYAIVGLITHFSLSIAFGVTFALLVVPLLSNTRALIAGAIVYGVLLYIVNYQILGRIVFKFFDPSNPMGPDPTFALFTHIIIFPLGIIPFFLTIVNRRGSAPAAHAAAERVDAERVGTRPVGAPERPTTPASGRGT